MMPDGISSHLIKAQTIVEKRYPEIHEKWVRLYTALANLGVVSILRHQGDMRFDLLLRGLEDEFAARFRAGHEGEVHFEDELQHTLTGYWLLATHDAVRLAVMTEAGKQHPVLPPLYQKLRLVRVALVKFQIAGDRGLVGGKAILLRRVGDGPEVPPERYAHPDRIEFHPVTVCDPDTGSIGWKVIDVANDRTETYFRRQLADELLSFT